jgi:hypothetical protein
MRWEYAYVHRNLGASAPYARVSLPDGTTWDCADATNREVQLALVDLGSDGWELLGVDSAGGVNSPPTTTFWLKRALPE